MNSTTTYVSSPMIAQSPAPRPRLRRSRGWPGLALVCAALLGACGAAPESVEDEAEMDLAGETQSVRVDETLPQPEAESTMDRAELESMIEREGLPLVDEDSTESELHSLCHEACPDSKHPAACFEYCACIRSSDPNDTWFSCWVIYLGKTLPKR